MFATGLARAYAWYYWRSSAHRGRGIVARLLHRCLGPVVLRTPEGPRMRLRLTSEQDLSVIRRGGTGEQTVRAEIDRLAPGDAFIDVGANIGWYSVLAARQVGPAGRVYAFEPSPREFRLLLDNLALNGATNVLAYSLALGGRCGEAVLSLEPAHTGMNRLVEGGADGKTRAAVPVCRGEAVLAHLRTERRAIALLKVDCEGAEYGVLEGFASLLEESLVRRVAVEVTPDFLARFGHTRDDLYGLMDRLGYRPTVNGTAWQFDEVFVPKESPG
jgi:FkbM family methyltransferase